MPNAHLTIQNLNAPVECSMPIWAFKIWMLRWHAQYIPSEHSISECSGGMYNAHLSIRNLNASIRNLNASAESPKPIWLLEIWMLCRNAQCTSKHLKNVNALKECQMPIWAFKIWMLTRNVQRTSEHSKSECCGGMFNAHLRIRNLNTRVERQMPICAFKIWKRWWSAQCLSKHLKLWMLRW